MKTELTPESVQAALTYWKFGRVRWCDLTEEQRTQFSDARVLLEELVEDDPLKFADLLNDILAAEVVRLQAVEASNAELREALSPFADEAKEWENCNLPEFTLMKVAAGFGQPEDICDSEFTLGDLRKARAILTKIPA
ncbi:MAG: hypothetical protein LBV12_08845 [Puniceicoccales bacterium]|jgi:hypothetical protein|nr:hypothetical protein [Puniceicoccales bacterium]